VAVWIVYVGMAFPANQWETFCMPRANRMVSFHAVPPGLDKLCRRLVPYPDTMQATNPFMQTNTRALVSCKPINVRGRAVNGARLTNAVVATWRTLSPDAQEDLLRRAEALLQSDQELEATEATEVYFGGDEGPIPASAIGRRPQISITSTPGLPSDKAAVRALVHDIHVDPYQAYYRRNPHGSVVTGWDARLKSYFWPTPECDRFAVSAILAPICAALAPLIASLGKWTPVQESQAVALANSIFDWGGVRQRVVTPALVEAVVARANGRSMGNAPMNSGWTKLAAMSTVFSPQPQAIWDSRVSASVITRLDALLPPSIVATTLFPHLGPIKANRGGLRRALLPGLRHTWPNGYRSWNGHMAGARLIQEMVGVLNDPSEQYPQMPALDDPAGVSGRWPSGV